MSSSHSLPSSAVWALQTVPGWTPPPPGPSLRIAGHLHGFQLWMRRNLTMSNENKGIPRMFSKNMDMLSTKCKTLQNYPIKFEHDMSRRIVMTTPTMLLIQLEDTRGIVNLFMTNVRNLVQKGWCTPYKQKQNRHCKTTRPTLTWNNTLEPPLLVLR